MEANKVDLQFAFDLFTGMQADNLGYIYRGNFTQAITENILLLAESNISSSGENAKIKKRVYSIMVECLQNITRHQDPERAKKPEDSGIFAIQKNKDKYFITTGNIIDNKNIPPLKTQLEKINSLKKEDLKQYYKEMLTAGDFSEKGGAGLGLIDIARKAENKLLFDFKKIDDNLSYFYLHTGLSSQAEGDEEITQDSLKNLQNLHNTLNKQDILLIFNGVFNQESLLNLLSIIESQMTGTISLKKKVFNIMIEMLQNIFKHSDNFEKDIPGKQGIFFLSEKNNKYLLNTGNYIRNQKVNDLKDKIDYVNKLNTAELNDFYNKSLLNFTIDSSKEAGLGIIDLKLKSEQKLEYDFHKIDNDFSFFTFQVSV